MSSKAPPVSAAKIASRSESFHLWRSRKDAVVRWLIGIGGVGVIFAVVLIFFYLLWVVFPLFLPAGSSLGETRQIERWSETTPLYTSIEEQQELGLRIADNGVAEFFRLDSGKTVQRESLPLAFGQAISLSAEAIEHNGTIAVASTDGQVHVVRHSYETRFEGGVETRIIEPTLDFPYGRQPLVTEPLPAPESMAFSDGDTEFVIAYAAGGEI